MSEISVKRQFLVTANQRNRNFPNDNAESGQLTYPAKDETAWNRAAVAGVQTQRKGDSPRLWMNGGNAYARIRISWFFPASHEKRTTGQRHLILGLYVLPRDHWVMSATINRI